MKKILLALALALASPALAADFPEISIQDLKKAADSKEGVIIDANGTYSYERGHIPGAIDYEAVKKDFAAKLPANKAALIIAYCSMDCGAYRKAAEAATKLGYTNVKYYPMGFYGWEREGWPVEKSK